MPFPAGSGRMKLLGKTHMSQRRLIEILRVVESAGIPVGARAISDTLCSRGYDLGERAVRYNLKILDELGFTKKNGYSGRMITPLGSRELSDALIDDRIGFANTRIEEYMLKSSFDPVSGRGEVIANISIVDKENAEDVFDIIGLAFDKGYAVSRRVLVLDEGDMLSSQEIPAGSLGLATVCSITIDGILMKKGIPVLTSFAGLAEIREKQACQFTDLIAYAGSSLDPMKIFMGIGVTSVACAIRHGSGIVLANVREVPLAARENVYGLMEASRAAGFRGLIKIGDPARPVLGCPVAAGKIGIAFYAGVNGAVAAEEIGAKIRTLPISALVEYSKMTDMD